MESKIIGLNIPMSIGGGIYFKSIAQAGEWAAENGGELALRNAIAAAKVDNGPSLNFAQAWLLEQERLRAEEHAVASLDVARESAQASSRAAKWAMWSALISLAATIVSAATYWFTRVPG